MSEHQFACAIHQIPICKCWARKVMKAEKKIQKLEQVLADTAEALAYIRDVTPTKGAVHFWANQRLKKIEEDLKFRRIN